MTPTGPEITPWQLANALMVGLTGHKDMPSIGYHEELGCTLHIFRNNIADKAFLIVRPEDDNGQIGPRFEIIVTQKPAGR